MGPVELSPEYLATRRSLHRVATHVLARARWARSGRFGLRVLPGGFGTPQFDDETVLRVSGGWLLHERRDGDSASTSVVELDGATLDELAAFVGIAFADGFSVGHDTPELGETTDLAAFFDEGLRSMGVGA